MKAAMTDGLVHDCISTTSAARLSSACGDYFMHHLHVLQIVIVLQCHSARHPSRNINVLKRRPPDDHVMLGWQL
jgi:hypothetical protein